MQLALCLCACERDPKELIRDDRALHRIDILVSEGWSAQLVLKTEEASSRETRTPRFIDNWCRLWYVHVAAALVNQLGNNRPVLPSNAYTTAQHGAIELARKPAIFFLEYSKRVT
jgi:hypothetical protein